VVSGGAAASGGPSASGAATAGSPAPGELAALPAPAPAAVPAPRRRGLRRIAVAVGGALVVLVVVIIVVVAGGGAARAPAPQDAQVVAPDPRDPPDRADPADDTIARANDLIERGQKSAAIDLLVAARKIYPQDARLPYIAGKLYFEKLYWTDGMKMFHDAIRLDPSYRTDRELIRTVLRGFITTPRADAGLAAFLHDEIGDEARPFLEETASEHPSSLIRARAASELRRYR